MQILILDFLEDLKEKARNKKEKTNPIEQDTQRSYAPSLNVDESKPFHPNLIYWKVQYFFGLRSGISSNTWYASQFQTMSWHYGKENITMELPQFGITLFILYLPTSVSKGLSN